MATWHLEEIEKRMHQMSWHITDRLDGDDHVISASWIIRRKTERRLDFRGMYIMTGRLLEQPFVCQINGTSIDLYFYRKGKMWDKALTEFISRLNELD